MVNRNLRTKHCPTASLRVSIRPANSLQRQVTLRTSVVPRSFLRSYRFVRLPFHSISIFPQDAINTAQRLAYPASLLLSGRRVLLLGDFRRRAPSFSHVPSSDLAVGNLAQTNEPPRRFDVGTFEFSSRTFQKG